MMKKIRKKHSKKTTHRRLKAQRPCVRVARVHRDDLAPRVEHGRRLRVARHVHVGLQLRVAHQQRPFLVRGRAVLGRRDQQQPRADGNITQTRAHGQNLEDAAAAAAPASSSAALAVAAAVAAAYPGRSLAAALDGSAPSAEREGTERSCRLLQAAAARASSAAAAADPAARSPPRAEATAATLTLTLTLTLKKF